MRGYGAALRYRSCCVRRRAVKYDLPFDSGVAVGVLAERLTVQGHIERLVDLIDIRKGDLSLALITERQPRRGRTFASTLRGQSFKDNISRDSVDQDGVGF